MSYRALKLSLNDQHVSLFLMKTGFYITRIHGIMIVQTECTEFLSSINRLSCQVHHEVAVHFDQ